MNAGPPPSSPLVLCTGVVRSGSTWSFNVCRELVAGWARRAGRSCHSGFLGEDQLERLVARDLRPDGDPAVVKAHAVGLRALACLRDGRARAVCTVRDPRDCVVSGLHFAAAPLEVVARRVLGNLAYLAYYRVSPRAMFVRYERMMADPAAEVARITAHLGLPADPAEVARVDAATNLAASRRICAEVGTRPAAQTILAEDHRVDPLTHLHENHIGSARVGRWRDELSAADAKYLTELFRPWLVELGYEPA